MTFYRQKRRLLANYIGTIIGFETFWTLSYTFICIYS